MADESLGETGDALLADLGELANLAADPRLGRRAFERLVAVRERRLPPDAQALLVARSDLARSLLGAQDFRAARALLEGVVAAWAAKTAPDVAAARKARFRLASSLRSLGELDAARTFFDDMIAGCERADPPDPKSLALARFDLGTLLYLADDFRNALALQEPAPLALETELPADDPSLASARGNLAITLYSLGELARARALQESVLANTERVYPTDHRYIVSARRGLANTLASMGDLAGARVLEERVLATSARTLDEDSDDLAMARASFGATLSELGEYSPARVLQERVLAQRESRHPTTHPAVLRARINLAATLLSQGDLSESRSLSESVVEILDRVTAEDHTLRVGARANLARCYYHLGEDEKARVLQVGVLESHERTRPAGHPEIISARLNLANTLKRLERGGEALDLQERSLGDLEGSVPDSSPLLAMARANLAGTLLMHGEFVRARTLLDAALASPSLRDDDVGIARSRPLELLCSLLVAEERARQPSERRPEAAAEFYVACRRLIEGERRILGRVVLEASPREAEERVTARRASVQGILWMSAGGGVFPADPELAALGFLLAESSRAAALATARIAAAARGDASVEALLSAARQASQHLARLAQAGGTAEEVDAAQRALDTVQRELVVRGAARIGGSTAGVDDLRPMAAKLGSDAVLVAWMRCARRVDPSTSVEFLTANVLCGGAEGPRLHHFEPGRIDALTTVVERWRAAIKNGGDRGLASAAPELDATQLGNAVRAPVLDPLLPALRGAKRLVVVLDDVLHTIPLDALPAGPFAPTPEGAALPLGEFIRIEYRSSAFEWLESSETPSEAGALVAWGHPAFDSQPTEAPDLEPETIAIAVVDASAPYAPAVLRGGAWERGFAPLTATREEVRGIGQFFEDAFGEESPRRVLERRAASRESLETLAPRARWLHVATHGWFAPESVRSSEDLDDEGTRSTSVEARVRGSSPMVLAGLALAGANLPADELGRYAGLVTAQEIASLDLGGCELAVLSACDTNVGVRRAGQGVASLQRALHMAGARSVITSLWKVPDEATKELMVDFYRRLWIQKKPKAQALWEAKERLREARDDVGRPLYATRDWAGWVLSGDPQ